MGCPVQQGDLETAPLIHLAIERDVPMVSLHDAFGECQPEAGARRRQGISSLVVRLKESIEHSLLVFGRDPDPGILYYYVGIVLAFCNLYRYFSSLRCEFKRVGQQVGKYFLELVRIEPH